MRWFAVLAVITALLWGAPTAPASQPPPPGSRNAHGPAQPSTRKHEGNAQSKQRGTHAAPLIVEIPPTQEQQRESAEITQERRGQAAREWWLVGFTALLTFATIALGIVTYLLWRSTNKAVRDGAAALDLANKTYIATHRPRMSIRGPFMFPYDNGFEMRFTIHNSGDSQGTIVEYKFFMVFNYGETTEFPIIQSESPIPPLLLRAGYDIQWAARTQILDLSAYRAAIDKATQGKPDAGTTIQFRGVVFYDDAGGGRRQSSFHRSYDFESKRFRRIENSEFEYD